SILGQNSNALKISITKSNSQLHDLGIQCNYTNLSDSVLLLPIKYFKEFSVQNFVFADSSVKYAGPDNQFAYDYVDLKKGITVSEKHRFLKKYCELDKKDYYQLKPGETLKLYYSFNELKYSGIKKSKYYKVQIKLHIAADFKEICPRMWTGRAESEISILKW
ncbi:MAG TPA: hypothetical protein VK484_05525, partial [Ferruginibacter sp.]|nr:hypothetical protein [Ferruginibacter sp.]